MRKNLWKQMLSALFCLLLFFGTMTVQAEEKIKHSTVDYDAMFLNSSQIFIGNKKTVDWEVGDKYFLHYTVTESMEDETDQWGLVVTEDASIDFPYLEGAMFFGEDESICEEGWTYLFRFEVTEMGLKYVAGKAKGTDSSYIQFPLMTGELKTKGSHFGVWITGAAGGTLSANFRNMRCYDEYGNDLGIYAPKAAKISVSEMNPLNVLHSYSFSVEEVPCFAFGNARYTDSDVVILEYTISNVKAPGLTQSGAEFTNAPTAHYPHADNMGYLNFDDNSKGKPSKLVTEGASYLVRFERQKDGFYVMVKRTQTNGAVDYFSFTLFAGKYSKDFGYVVMWLGQEELKLTADFTNVKCYDDKGNNLAIQTNKGVKVTHYGDLEDYTECIADYYCEENQTIISLKEDEKAEIKVVGENGSEKGTYSIGNAVFKLTMGEKKEEWVYAYEYIQDTEGNKYMRLRENKVTFKSQSVNGDVLSVAVVNAETDWKVSKPENPTKGNGNFTGWVDGSGKAYDFDSIVTEAKTVYATWDGEQTWDVLQTIADIFNTNVVVSAIICVLLIGGTTVGMILFVRKRGKSWKQK